MQKTTKVLTGAAALATAFKVTVDEDFEEIDRVDVVGIPIFKRDDKGRPKVFGILFPRWLRGPRT